MTCIVKQNFASSSDEMGFKSLVFMWHPNKFV